MKLFITIIGFSLFFTSCNHTYFMETQPKGGVRLSEIPKELFGTWYDEYEGWKVNKNGFTEIKINRDSFDNIKDTVYKTSQLSDSLRIYKAEEFYFLNARAKNRYWEFVIIKPLENGDVNVYACTEPLLFTTSKELKLEKKDFNVDDDTQSNALYSGQLKIKTIRNLLNQMTLSVYTKDGKIVSQ